MSFDQYHEPVNELSDETRTFARMIVSLGEEAEAINWLKKTRRQKPLCKMPSTKSLNTLAWTWSFYCDRNRYGVKL
jgi:hypothetical protein